MSAELRQVLEALGGAGTPEELGERILATAHAAGDECHEAVKRHAMTLPTVRAAIAMGVEVAVGILLETIQFGERSMEEDDEEDGEGAATIRRATLELFRQRLETEIPRAFERTH